MTRLADMRTDGVIQGLATELKATSPKAQTVRLEPGGAIVGGHSYELTAALNFTLSLPTKGDTAWILVLRADWEERAIIAVMLRARDGDLREPTLSHCEGITWDLPLYAGRITVEGGLSILPKWFYSEERLG